jgi:hypothetical protein
MIVGRNGKTHLLYLILPLPPGVRRGEGSGFLCNLQQHTFDVLKYIEIAEMYGANASCSQEHSPIFIFPLPRACVMLSTIEFNAELAA